MLEQLADCGAIGSVDITLNDAYDHHIGAGPMRIFGSIRIESDVSLPNDRKNAEDDRP